MTFAGKHGAGWAFVANWTVPIMMGIAYTVLALTSDTDTSGKAWMAVGFGFVLVIWFVFRTLTEHAALSRAVAVGDGPRILELTKRPLARKHGAAAVPLHVHRAFACELQGDFTAALAEADAAKLDAEHRERERNPVMWVLAACARIGPLVELDRTAEARTTLDEVLPVVARLDRRLAADAHLQARLAHGRVLAAEHSADAAKQLQSVVDDVRAGIAQRAIAHDALSRIDGAKAHREQVSKLLPGSWFARRA